MATEDKPHRLISRRLFLRMAGLATIAAELTGILAACASSSSLQPTAPVVTVVRASDTRLPAIPSPTTVPSSTSEVTKTPIPFLFPTPTQPAMPTPSNRKIQGDLLGFSIPDPFVYQTEDLTRKDYQLMRQTGARWVRIETYWCEIEVERQGSFDWSKQDFFFETAKENGLNIIWIVRGAPAWASQTGQGNHDSAPKDEILYGEFCKALTLRYLPKIKAAGLRMAIEEWNEPNMPAAFLPWSNDANTPSEESAKQFTLRVVIPGYKGTKAAIDQLNQQFGGYAPADVPVLAGGLAGAVGSGGPGNTVKPEDFVSAFYAYGAKGYFDAISTHPYCYPNLTEFMEVWGMLHTEAIYQIMQQNGDGEKKIWGTETGFPTNPTDGMVDRKIPEAQLAGGIHTMLDTWFSRPYAGPLIWFNFRDIQSFDSEEALNFGLIHSDYSPKKGDPYAAFSSCIKKDA